MSAHNIGVPLDMLLQCST